jgi:hypothetical protein
MKDAGQFTTFDDWDCERKHTKRIKHWLPYATVLRKAIGANRDFRYLTFCAPSMIDVFMLLRAGVLRSDKWDGPIREVVFCEKDPDAHAEITGILGKQGSGFARRLESLVLFEDDRNTLKFANVREIEKYFGKKGEMVPARLRERLTEKKEHLQLLAKFPFDFINLDFCGYYYPPPHLWTINQSVNKILELQKRFTLDEAGNEVMVDRFLVSVTCRIDQSVPEDVWRRLERIFSENKRNHAEYDAVVKRQSVDDPQAWRIKNPEEFFLAVWPKELLAFSQMQGWKMEIKDLVYYRRRPPGKPEYRMACLVSEFVRSSDTSFYLEQALGMLDPHFRTFIGKSNPRAPDSLKLLADLKELVGMRNVRAKRIGIRELSPPEFRAR